MIKYLLPSVIAATLAGCGGTSSTSSGQGQVKFTLANLTGGWGGKSTYQQTNSVLITMDHVTGNVAFVGQPKTLTLKASSSGPSETSASLTVDAAFNQHPCHYTDSSGGQTCTALEGHLPTGALYFAFSVPEWKPGATVSVTMNGASPMAFTSCKGAVGGTLETAQRHTNELKANRQKDSDEEADERRDGGRLPFHTVPM